MQKVNNMRTVLLNKYNNLLRACGIENYQSESDSDIIYIIKKNIVTFLQECQNVAIWGAGKHTEMLMSDFIYEMKSIQYVIDSNGAVNENIGYKMITPNMIAKKEIDGVIISTYRYKEEIKKQMKKYYPNIRYLDIYDVLEDNGIKLCSEYYANDHPYEKYLKINMYKRIIRKECGKSQKDAWENLIHILIEIKDFLLAIKCVEAYLLKYGNPKYEKVLDMLKDLYHVQIEAMGNISKHNVLMLCFDALRRQDVFGGNMPNLKKYLDENTELYDNAYSVSTSTYESLIPAYGNNMNMQTKYYEKNIIKEEDCLFIQKALQQKRKIHFYTDSTHYIDCEKIEVNESPQTATEKMWSFLLDAIDETNGLFYVHILYESHFSYPNPYTEANVVAGGMSIFFDFLDRNGGALKANYEQQHKDAISYLDDVIVPLIQPLRLGMLIYSDHGIPILSDNMKLENVTYPMLTMGNDLIEILFAVKCENMKIGLISRLESLFEVNNIIISLLDQKQYTCPRFDCVKIQRSDIYNPDYHFIYKKLEYDKGLQAFEAFIFKDQSKLVVYKDGTIELYDKTDQLILDDGKSEKYFSLIKEKITVVNINETKRSN